MSNDDHFNAQPQLGPRVFLHASAQVLGNVEIGGDVSIWCNAVVRGDVNRIVIGAGSNVQDLVMCHVSHKTPAKPEGSPLLIGERVTIGHSAILHGCSIGDECLIGMGSIVMDDVVIGDRVMLAAGSLVAPRERLEGGWLYVGRPARKVRPLTQAELEFLPYSAGHYVRLKDKYLARG